VHTAKGTSSFIEFSDVASAVACHGSMQGTELASSNGPIRIQFSKTPFGRKRDATGQFVETSRAMPAGLASFYAAIDGTAAGLSAGGGSSAAAPSPAAPVSSAALEAAKAAVVAAVAKAEGLKQTGGEGHMCAMVVGWWWWWGVCVSVCVCVYWFSRVFWVGDSAARGHAASIVGWAWMQKLARWPIFLTAPLLLCAGGSGANGGSGNYAQERTGQ
jgi:hypothetical protein